MQLLMIEMLAGALLVLPAVWMVRRFPQHERLLAGLVLILASALYPALGLAAGVSASSMPFEWLAFLVTALLAALGIRVSMWFLAVGWLLHGPWDFMVPHIEDVSHMPSWYAGLCLGYDLVFGAYFAVRALGGMPVQMAP